MNKDQSLRAKDRKVTLLVVGNDDTGKKSITRQWMNKYTGESEECRAFYKIFNLLYEDFIDDERKVSIPVEIRVINGDELDTDMKINASYFKGALGAFVVTAIDEFMSFQE